MVYRDTFHQYTFLNVLNHTFSLKKNTVILFFVMNHTLIFKRYTTILFYPESYFDFHKVYCHTFGVAKPYFVGQSYFFKLRSTVFLPLHDTSRRIFHVPFIPNTIPLKHFWQGSRTVCLRPVRPPFTQHLHHHTPPRWRLVLLRTRRQVGNPSQLVPYVRVQHFWCSGYIFFEKGILF